MTNRMKLASTEPPKRPYRNRSLPPHALFLAVALLAVGGVVEAADDLLVGQPIAARTELAPGAATDGFRPSIEHRPTTAAHRPHRVLPQDAANLRFCVTIGADDAVVCNIELAPNGQVQMRDATILVPDPAKP